MNFKIIAYGLIIAGLTSTATLATAANQGTMGPDAPRIADLLSAKKAKPDWQVKGEEVLQLARVHLGFINGFRLEQKNGKVLTSTRSALDNAHTELQKGLNEYSTLIVAELDKHLSAATSCGEPTDACVKLMQKALNFGDYSIDGLAGAARLSQGLLISEALLGK